MERNTMLFSITRNPLTIALLVLLALVLLAGVTTIVLLYTGGYPALHHAVFLNRHGPVALDDFLNRH